MPSNLSQLVLVVSDQTQFTRPEAELDSQVRLAEVGLDTVGLVMDVVIVGVVGEEELQRVPPQSVPAVIIDRLDGREGEEEDGFPSRQSGESVRNGRSDRIEQEAL